MSQPVVVATVAGDDGWATVFVSFKTLVAADGALEATPTVEDVTPDLATSSTPLLTWTGTIDGVTYAAGEMFTFKATRVGTAKGVALFDVAFESPLRVDTERVAVRVAAFGV